MPARRPVTPPDPKLVSKPALVLGIEGGGTRTTALVAGAGDKVVAQFVTGPGNIKLLTDRELLWRIREIAERLPVPVSALAAVCLGMAGARTEADRERVRRAASRVFPRIPCTVTDDLRTALAAAPARRGARARVLMVSGTGSCCFGEGADGRTAKVGGRGHLIGDRGSACDIGLRALRELVAWADRAGEWPKLGALLLDWLSLTLPDELIDWSMRADKTALASLAIPVFQAAAQRDPLARRILADAAAVLTEDALACAARIAAPGEPVDFVFNGGVLEKNPAFARDVTARLRAGIPGSRAGVLTRPSVWGAVVLARALTKLPPVETDTLTSPVVAGADAVFGPDVVAASPTEQRNPRSLHLDTMPLKAAVQLMLDEEASVPDALRTETEAIVWVVRKITDAFLSGGRLFYVGAGTSGRLGVLDASECPPTFRAPREQVQGIIAGGQTALWSAVEGAEDDAPAGAAAIAGRRVEAKDVVIGIAASGRTPFVWGALEEAGKRGATTVLVCFNPAVKAALKRSRFRRPDRIIAPSLGPEVLTGSTRLKSGTATKQLLNLFTTLAMTRSGKVIGNLMIDLNPSNVKLRGRAVRIVSELTGAPPDQAHAALDAAGWIVKTAVQTLGRKG